MHGRIKLSVAGHVCSSSDCPLPNNRFHQHTIDGYSLVIHTTRTWGEFTVIAKKMPNSIRVIALNVKSLNRTLLTKYDNRNSTCKSRLIVSSQ